MEDKPSKQGKNKAFIDNQWKEGQSGNPGGRPQTKRITALLDSLLDADSGDGKTNADIIAENLIKLVKDATKRGYAPMLKELLDRTEGKVADTHLVAGIMITPELLEQAQKRLSMSLNDTQELIEEHKDAI